VDGISCFITASTCNNDTGFDTRISVFGPALDFAGAFAALFVTIYVALLQVPSQGRTIRRGTAARQNMERRVL
jgi:hypothetical protein